MKTSGSRIRSALSRQQTSGSPPLPKSRSVHAPSRGPALAATAALHQNWSTHGFIRSDLRRSLTTERLERYVRVYRNMRLRDRALGRGVAAQKQRARALKDPKEYPLHTGEWSSCDESDNEGDLDAIRATMGF